MNAATVFNNKDLDRGYCIGLLSYDTNPGDVMYGLGESVGECRADAQEVTNIYDYLVVYPLTEAAYRLIEGGSCDDWETLKRKSRVVYSGRGFFAVE
ncbi:hypothetical protein [Roseateles albus]|uniref:Uncharacterized protein n=1 Tax=Roseateles albus TaxID=2987525 RepID=A0ABT5KFL2_9BURK|nr:hypothetical protein [Roseateles albus]MDC8771750.1 hypothetical protein [Roseateles albus]